MQEPLWKLRRNLSRLLFSQLICLYIQEALYQDVGRWCEAVYEHFDMLFRRAFFRVLDSEAYRSESQRRFSALYSRLPLATQNFLVNDVVCIEYRLCFVSILVVLSENNQTNDLSGFLLLSSFQLKLAAEVRSSSLNQFFCVARWSVVHSYTSWRSFNNLLCGPNRTLVLENETPIQIYTSKSIVWSKWESLLRFEIYL